MDSTDPTRTNFYSSAGHDRGAQLRRDPAAIARLQADPGARFVPVVGSLNLFTLAGIAVAPGRAELTDAVLASGTTVWLGEFEGTPHFALLLDEHDDRAQEELARHGRLRDLRRESGRLPAAQGSMLATARALAHWHAHNRHCSRCGAPTAPVEAGHARTCTNDACGHKQFPRLDPAVIVRVTRGERLLLARQPHWPPRRYSVLAGFVEPGESAEDAVVREVREEAGIEVDEVNYQSSQPWPYPHALMLGFSARARSDALRVDHEELAEARWIERTELAAALADGAIRMPPPFSIAHRLIREWLGAEVPAAGLWETD